MRIPLPILLFASILLVSCGMDFFAGGSAGTDNPQASEDSDTNQTVVLTITDKNGVLITDSIRLQIYQSNQNPILNPDPIIDTVIQGGSLTLNNVDTLYNSTNVIISNENISYYSTLPPTGIDTIQISTEQEDRVTVNVPISMASTGDTTLDSSVTVNPLSLASSGYIPGTPWFGPVTNGYIALPAIPSGTYPLILLDSLQAPIDTITLTIP